MRYLRIALCFFLALALCACSVNSVEELLYAPSLTEDQSGIIGALNEASGSEVSLRYPRYGTRRSSVQFVDFDNDGTSEAVAFYSLEDSPGYLNLAVLTEDPQGQWSLAATTQGSGTEVYSVNVISLQQDDQQFLLVEWSSSSLQSRRISVYNFADGSINTGFEDSCIKIVVSDMDSDGSLEFCYVTEESGTGALRVKYVDSRGSSLSVVNDHGLSSSAVGVNALVIGSLSDGKTALFVDEMIDEDQYTTEIFYVDGDGCHALKTVGGYDITDLMTRNCAIVSSAPHFGRDSTLVPSSTPHSDIARFPDIWTYWYAVAIDSVRCVAVEYVSEQFLFAFRVPDNWYSSVLVSSREDMRRFFVTDVDSGVVLLEIHVLAVDEEDSELLEEGFLQLTASGSYRYYMRYNCSEQEKSYIENNFRTI